MRYLTKGVQVDVEAGQLVYRTGESVADQSIFYMVSGTVKLVRRLRDGSHFAYVCGPEDIFGIVSTMADADRHEDALALENCRLYVWDRVNFEACVSLYIEFARLAIQNLSRYLRAVNRELAKAEAVPASSTPART